MMCVHCYLQVQAKIEELGPIPDHSAEIQQLTNQQLELGEQVGSTVLLHLVLTSAVTHVPA